MSSLHKYHHGNLKNALIQAGIEILSRQGVNALSLRKVAQRVGVSHAAPYAHFADKQELIAAISTAGFVKLYDQLQEVQQRYAGDPIQQLVEGAWCYLEFASNEPDHFKITLSGVIEKEKDYPAYVAISHQTFELVVASVQACQQAGFLKPGPADLLAVTIWGMLHGIASLILENQVPHVVLDRFTLRQMLIFSLNQMALVDIETLQMPKRSL